MWLQGGDVNLGLFPRLASRVSEGFSLFGRPNSGGCYGELHVSSRLSGPCPVQPSPFRSWTHVCGVEPDGSTVTQSGSDGHMTHAVRTTSLLRLTWSSLCLSIFYRKERSREGVQMVQGHRAYKGQLGGNAVGPVHLSCARGLHLSSISSIH